MIQRLIFIFLLVSLEKKKKTTSKYWFPFILNSCYDNTWINSPSPENAIKPNSKYSQIRFSSFFLHSHSCTEYTQEQKGLLDNGCNFAELPPMILDILCHRVGFWIIENIPYIVMRYG